jgi:hypothetical protein
MLKLYMSGKHVDPLNLRVMDLDIRDIANNLSMLCRYTGAFPFHYSVGQHSMLVARMMEDKYNDPMAALAGLLHDAAEYVFGDVNYHLKKLPELAEYNRREHEPSQMIIEVFGAGMWFNCVKPFDRAAAHLEMAIRDGKSIRGSNYEIIPQPQSVVYHRFLSEYEKLTGARFNRFSHFSSPFPSPSPHI